MSPEIEGLANSIDETATLLDASAEGHWAHWLREAARFLRKGDLFGAEHLLSAYGGMGSFNDINLPNAGDNARLGSLRSALYTQAKSLLRAQA